MKFLVHRRFIILFIFLCGYFALFNFQRINFVAADLGRHIENGRIIVDNTLQGNWNIVSSALYTNFYSYTSPSFPFVNHHWLSGVFAFFAYKVGGFTLLSIIYAALMLGALWASIAAARRHASWQVWLPLACVLIPLMADRTEVRPEAASYFLIAFFIYLIPLKAPIKGRRWILVPLLMLVWANLHVYFIFGFFIMGAYGLEALLRKDWAQFKTLAKTAAVSLAAICLNPFGPYLLYYPFVIFKNYGYTIVENQSIAFLMRLHFSESNFLWWHVASVLIILAGGAVLALDRRRFPIALGVIALAFGVLSFEAIRNFSIFGFVALPFLAECGEIIFEHIPDRLRSALRNWLLFVGAACVVLALVRISDRLPLSSHSAWGIGLLPGEMQSAEFARANHIPGPIFNNYDIGSYLEFNGFQTFVDNRPEAYSAYFLQNTYIPMQEDGSLWQKELSQYDFNTIWFYRLDQTPWAQSFLIARIHDPEWVPIYVDDYTIIFVRNDTANQSLITKYALPKSMFSAN